MRQPHRGRASSRPAFAMKVETLEARELLSAARPADFGLAKFGAGPMRHGHVAQEIAQRGHHDRALADARHHAAPLARLSAPRPLAHRMRPFVKLRAAIHPDASGPVAGAYSPVQIREAYGFDKISFASYTSGGSLPLPGAGQTIAIVDAYDDPNISGDLATFDQQYGIPAPPSLTRVNQSGSTNRLPGKDLTGGWELEETLDVEWAHAIAPGASIVLVEANSAGTSDLLAAVQTAASYSGVSVVSMSWGGGDTSNDAPFTTPAGHAPVVFVASSGDNGAPVSWPAISSNVLAVGGTTLNLTSSTGAGGTTWQWSSESGWRGSGGGISSAESQPSYQQGVVSQSSTARTNPDVAYDADPNTGFSIYDSFSSFGRKYNWTEVGGTSAGAPQWAALIAIADQGRFASHEANLTSTSTQPIPAGSALAQGVLYGLFDTGSAYSSTYFHDIVTGSSSGSPSYAAGPGYDLVTGLGTPHADQIAAALVNPPAMVAPVAPTTLTAAPDAAGPITLTWNAVPGATQYNIYRQNPDGTWPTTPLFTTSAATASVQNTGVVPGTTYTYEVTAENPAGESGPSPIASATAAPQTIFSDNFSTPGTLPNANWGVAGTGGNWVISNNVLSQNSTAAGDLKKAVVEPVTTTSTSEEITAKVRIDSWADGEYARAGLGLFTNASTGQGYNVVVRDRNGGSRNTIQFFVDGVGWGNSYTVPSLSVGTWYDFRLLYEGGSLYANVWQDGTSEPPTWQYVQTQYVGTGHTGSPSLNGGSSGTATGEGPSYATVSFANVTVTGS